MSAERTCFAFRSDTRKRLPLRAREAAGTGEDWWSSIDIVLRRFAEYYDLEGACGRHGTTTRATGVLMERHSIAEENAFAMLRHESRTSNRKVIDLAAGVIGGHRLLPKTPQTPLGPDA